MVRLGTVCGKFNAVRSVSPQTRLFEMCVLWQAATIFRVNSPQTPHVDLK